MAAAHGRPTSQITDAASMVVRMKPERHRGVRCICFVGLLDHSDRERERQALAVRASGPTARPAHAGVHLINAKLDAALSRRFLLGRSDPTDPLVTCERGEVGPKPRGCRIELDGLSEICGELMNRAVREFLSGHISKSVIPPNTKLTDDEERATGVQHETPN
jgi:hypothetical protein